MSLLRRTALALLLFPPAASVWAAGAPAWGPKPYGVLLLGMSDGREWRKTVEDVRKTLGKQVPLETVTGTFGPRSIQKALDRLHSANIRKIVAVPVFLYPCREELDQLRYLLGIEKYPSEAFLDKWRMKGQGAVRRPKTKLPVVLSEPLGDDAAVAEALLTRAREMSRDPAKESVFLITRGEAEESADRRVRRTVDSVTRKLAELGAYRSVRSYLIRPPADKKPRQEEESWRRLREAVRSTSVRGRVILLPYLLEQDGTERGWRKHLDNLFYRWKGKGLLPNDGIVSWIEGSVAESRIKPDMRKYKDDGLALPAKKRERIVQ